MWAYGVVLYKCFFPNSQVIILNDKNYATVPSHENADLSDLLLRLLQRSPTERLSAEEALAHPFFKAEMEGEPPKRSIFKDLNTHINELQTALDKVKLPKKWFSSSHVASVEIDPDSIVETTLFAFRDLTEPQLCERISISIKAPEGMNFIYGETNTWVFQRLFSKVFDKDANLFEKTISGTHYLPLAGSNLELLLAFGKLLFRVILVEQTIDLRLAPSVWKYMLGIKPNLRDLEVFDPLLYHSLQRIIVLQNVTQLAVTFEGLCANGEQIPVTDQNKHEFVDLTVNQILVESRKTELEALKLGFFTVQALNPLLQALSPTDLQLMLSKNDYLIPQMLTPILQFRDFPPSSKTQANFLQLLNKMDTMDLKRLLLYVTERAMIPMEGLINPNEHSTNPRDKISIVNAGLPSEDTPLSHVCFYQLDLPDYNDQVKVLREKIIQVIKNTQGRK